MSSFYFSCGQQHRHVIDATHVWDKNSLLQVQAEDEDTARDFVFKKFGDKWCFSYHEEDFLNIIEYFPGGIAYIYII